MDLRRFGPQGFEWHRARVGAKGAHRPRLIIMVKEPLMGRVKTRLGKDVGQVAATYACRAMLAATIARLSEPRRWQIALAVSPDAAVSSHMLPPGTARLRQGQGDLGRRMQRAFESCGPGPALTIGADIPTVTPSVIANAFRALGGARAVLGPAGDGGYWVIGVQRHQDARRAFTGVRWSTEHALADTLANLPSGRIRLTAELPDVDTAADLKFSANAIGRRVLPRSPAAS